MTHKKRLAIEPVRMLASLSPFASLDAKTVGRLIAVCEIQRVEKSDVVFQQDERIHYVHFLISGRIKRSTSLYDQTERVLDIIQPGQAVCLSEALCSASYRSTARAIETSHVLAIPLATLRTIVQSDGTLGLNLLEYLARECHASEFAVLSHHSLPASQRVLDYLVHLAGNQRGTVGETTVQLDSSKQHTAARLNMTPETFSRTLKQLRKDGIIVVYGRQVHLQNAALSIYAPGTSQSLQLRYPRKGRGTTLKLSPATLINLCGRLRMLSQRMATAWIMHALGLRPQAAHVALRKYRNEFEDLLAQLDATELPEFLHTQTDAVANAWQTYGAQLIDPDPSRSAAEAIFKCSEDVLLVADRLTAEVTRSAGTPTYEPVNIAGRNRMLSASIIKLLLLRAAQVCQPRAEQLIDEAQHEFAENVQRLRAFPGNTAKAVAQLELAVRHWQDLLASFDDTGPMAGETNRLLALIDCSEALLRHADTTVKVYELLLQEQR